MEYLVNAFYTGGAAMTKQVLAQGRPEVRQAVPAEPARHGAQGAARVARGASAEPGRLSQGLPEGEVRLRRFGVGRLEPPAAGPPRTGMAEATTSSRFGKRVRSGAATAAMLLPGGGWLVLFFLVPLYYVFLFSTGQRWQGVTKAAAFVNGELTSFSWDLWGQLLGPDLRLDVLGASVTMPLWVVGFIEAGLLALALLGGRLGRYGRYVSPDRDRAARAAVHRDPVGARPPPHRRASPRRTTRRCRCSSGRSRCR